MIMPNVACCGESLRDHSTTLYKKLYKGSVVIPHPESKML